MDHHPAFTTLTVELIKPHIARVNLDRPLKLNSMNTAFWLEIKLCFQSLDRNPDVRVVLLAANGKAFTAGLDLFNGPSLIDPTLEASRASLKFLEMVAGLQASFTAIEQCSKPVIACIHGACIGGGIDLITACDIRLATTDARFCVKEIDLGIVADVGTLQRLPKVVNNQSFVREVCLSGRWFDGIEAQSVGLTTKIFDTQKLMMEYALQLATTIALKSPVAIVGTKNVLNFSRDHSVDDGLKYVAVWNSAMISSKDVQLAIAAAMTKSVATFSKL